MPRMPVSHWKGLVQNGRMDVLNARTNDLPADMSEQNTRKRVNVDGKVFVASKRYLLKGFPVESREQRDFMLESIAAFKLNYEQEKAFRIVANHATDPYSEALHMYVGGMGGTGKSQVLKALSHFFALRKESYRLIVVAPTGSAAALLGGMTYHSAFGINEKATKPNLSAVKDRLTCVDYVFFDEVSMISCRDLYRISEQLCRALNTPEESFGGLNMILVGDFAQLPPAVGGEPTSLYGHIKYSPGNVNKQKEVIGQSIWHEFTTVVMLKQNMRQVKEGDDEFRTMLENMRYKDCTWEDIRFLRSRISSPLPGRPSVCDPQFRNVSIITTRNLLKDTMNEIGSKRFAEETGQTLTYFYSEDEISASPDRTGKRVKGKVQAHQINQTMQRDLWYQLPSTTKRHVPGRIGLCVGMPVLIRNNSATELGITNGQEGVVHGWQEGRGFHGQPVLETLFVQLSKPPTPVRLNGLPSNVVPISPTTTTQLLCSLRGGMKVLIDRTQVEVLPNFAMTDFASQGKTRDFNVVDLQACSTHQSMYTALSRGTCAEGTILLRDFSPSVVMNSISGRQRQEFRELAMLDDITDQRYNGTLPVEIFGIHRKELIASYRNWKGDGYVPESMHKSLHWSEDRPWVYDNNPHLSWEILDGDEDRKKKRGNKGIREDVDPHEGFIPARGSNPLKRKLNDVSDAIPKRKAKKQKNADADTRKQEHAPSTIHRHAVDATAEDPVGSQWENNSCAYDAILCILYRIWSQDPTKWTGYFESSTELAPTILSAGFSNYRQGVSALEQVREIWRRHMAIREPQSFSFGAYTGVVNLIDCMFQFRTTVFTLTLSCEFCQALQRPDLDRRATAFDIDGGDEGLSVQSWVTSCFRMPEGHQCPICTRRLLATRTFVNNDGHILFFNFARHEQIVIDTILELPLNSPHRVKRYQLVGLIYFGGSHFTSRIIKDRQSWFHDGIVTGSETILEGTTDSLGNMTRRGTSHLQTAVYIPA